MPTRCNRSFYCRSYCLLNMFRAPLSSSSGAQEYYTVVAACGISCCGFQVVGLMWNWGLCVQFAGCCSILQTVHLHIMFLSEWHEFPSAPCPAVLKKMMTARVSMLLKSRASPDILPFSLCNKKGLAIRYMNRPPLSNDTIDSVLRHREEGWVKDLSSPPLSFLQFYQFT